MIDIEAILKELANSHPVFHLERDFQHDLAWAIQVVYPSARIRQGSRQGESGKREYIDIWVENDNQNYALELKYKTRKILCASNGQQFSLLNQGAQDHGRYDFLKDITRLERLTTQPHTACYVIMLTNDDQYWRTTSRSTVDADFRIHEGRTLHGTLKWGDGASEGTTKGRREPLVLTGTYQLHWSNYSQLPVRGPNQFRYLLLKIRISSSGSAAAEAVTLGVCRDGMTEDRKNSNRNDRRIVDSSRTYKVLRLHVNFLRSYYFARRKKRINSNPSTSDKTNIANSRQNPAALTTVKETIREEILRCCRDGP